MPDPLTAPAAKRPRVDGNVALIDQSVLLAAQDPEAWVASRRRNWPTRERTARRLAEAAEGRANTRPGQLDGHFAGAPTNQSKKPEDARSGARQPQRRQPCRFFQRGRCTAGTSCRFSHEPATAARPPRPGPERVYKRFEPPTKASLFVKLVQTDHDAEDQKLLDFIDYLHRTGNLG